MNTEADPQAGSIDQAVPGGRPWVRWGGFAASLALLAACIYYASTETDWSHVREARTEHIAGLVGLLVAGLVLNALMFQVALLASGRDGSSGRR